jgi:hypothetical protein
MSSHVRANAGCLLVGEYVDEAERPVDEPAARGEVVRPQIVADFIDLWGTDQSLREFTVLLRDGRVVAVRGHCLKHEPHPQGGEDVYGIVVRAGEDEVLVAIFKSHDVSGIFCGEIRTDRRIA